MVAKRIRRLMACLTALALLLPLGATGAGEDGAFPAASIDAPQSVRVLLTRFSAFTRLDMTLNGSYSADTDGGSMMFGRGADITVLLRDGRLYLYYMDMRVDAGTGMTLARHPVEEGTLNGIVFANNPAVYEGDLRLSVTDDGKLSLLLTVGVEDYVKGVVPYEMSDSFPLEALKAQAVAARTYAVSKAILNAGGEYDLVDNTNDQVYRGRRVDYPNATQAVDDTAGVCGFYNGALAMCYYSASNGGQTELASHVWGSKADDGYLDMRDDPYDLENPQSKVQSVTLPKSTDEVTQAPYALRLLLSGVLADTLTAAGYDAAPESLRVDTVTAVWVDTPMYEAPSRLYTMLHMTLTYSARTRTDFADPAAPTPTPHWEADDEEVSLYTPAPTAVPTPSPAETPAPTATATPEPTPTPTPAPSYGPFVSQGEAVTLDIPIFPDAEKGLSLGINYYDNEMVTVTEQEDSFTIESRRFGHGVGLSQRGAQWMAGTYQKTFTEILAFYYPGMSLMRVDTAQAALPAVTGPLSETAGPVPTPTPRPTLMPVTQALLEGAWYATVTEIDDDSTLNLRAAPDISAEIVMKLYKNQKLMVLEECPQEDWVHVRTDAAEGYVMKKFLTRESDAQATP